MKSFLLLIIFMITIAALSSELSMGCCGLMALNNNCPPYYEMSSSAKIISIILTLVFFLVSLFLNFNFVMFSVKLKRFKIISTIINTILPLTIPVFIAMFFSIIPLIFSFLENSKLDVVKSSMGGALLLLWIYPLVVYTFFIRETLKHYKE